MSNVTVHHEVRLNESSEWQPCFQWCTDVYDDDSPDEHGYRFIWRRPDGSSNLHAVRRESPRPQTFSTSSGWRPEKAGLRLSSTRRHEVNSDEDSG